MTAFNDRVASNLTRKAAFDQYAALAAEWGSLDTAIKGEREALAATLEGAVLSPSQLDDKQHRLCHLKTV